MDTIQKPCWTLHYCPYGALVEQFPLPEDTDTHMECQIFGHICPVFFVAERICEK
jgi:hypothetical protein